MQLFSMPWRPGVTGRDKDILRTSTKQWLHFGPRKLRVFKWSATGPTVLLLHGWSSRAARLSQFVGPLRSAGFSVIAFDAPGHGASTGKRCDVFAYRDAIGAVVEQSGPVHGVIGHSFGARAALLHLAVDTPSQFSAAVLLGTTPDAEHMLRQFELVLALRGDVSRIMRLRLERIFGRATDKHNDEEHARHCSVPVLVMHNVDDDVAPALHAQKLALQLPRGTLFLTRDLNHCGSLDEGSVIDSMVQFMCVHCLAVQLAQGAG